MLYEFRDGMIFARRLEYSAAYHCNLRCRSSHMSPFVPKQFPTLASFEADLDRLGEVLRTRRIQLIGGEPLLNPEIVELIRIARRSKVSSNVNLTTNGLLLPKMPDEFWEEIENIVITVYPSVRLPPKTVETIQARAAESNTPLTWRRRENFRSTIVTEPHPMDRTTRWIFRTCKSVHKYQCLMLHEGRLFKCAVPAFLPYYRRALKRNGYDPKVDAFDIHASRNLYDDLRAFLTSTTPLQACRYCLGYVGKKIVHVQIPPEMVKHPASERATRATHLSKTRLVREIGKYFSRRVVEKLTGRPKW